MMKDEPNQSSSRPRSSTTSSAPRKVATSMKPTTSNPSLAAAAPARSARAAGDSRRTSAISAIAIMPTGPLIRKHQCQEIVVGQPAAECRPDHRGNHHRDAEHRKGLAALFRRKQIGQDRLRDRHHAATADALQQAKQQQRISDSSAKPHNNELTVNSPRQIRKKVLRPSFRARKLRAVRMIALETR